MFHVAPVKFAITLNAVIVKTSRAPNIIASLSVLHLGSGSESQPFLQLPLLRLCLIDLVYNARSGCNEPTGLHREGYQAQGCSSGSLHQAPLSFWGNFLALRFGLWWHTPCNPVSSLLLQNGRHMHCAEICLDLVWAPANCRLPEFWTAGFMDLIWLFC